MQILFWKNKPLETTSGRPRKTTELINQSIWENFENIFFDTFNNDDSGFDTEKNTHNDEDELPHI